MTFTFKIGDPLPPRDDLERDQWARAFWRLSYACGRDYVSGKDARNETVLVKHEREEADSYARRQRIAKPRNHCGPIIRKYNDFVFRRPATRKLVDQPSFYQDFIADVDAQGSNITAFMREALRSAQIDREVYLLVDSTVQPGSGERTKAQAEEAGDRLYIRTITADCVVNWRDRDGLLTEVLIQYEDDDGLPFAVYYTEEYTQRIQLKWDSEDEKADSELVVASVDEPVEHELECCPVVRLRPKFDLSLVSNGESQISPLAELQQSTFNLQSLLMEEIYNCTFTQIVATGTSKDDVADLMVGNNRLICLPNDKASWQTIGADPEQAATISAAIMAEQTEIYRTAGITAKDPMKSEGDAKSGAALAIEFNDLQANLAALADAVEEAENAILCRVSRTLATEEPEPVIYPQEFDTPDFGVELNMVIRALTASALPNTIKHEVVNRFAARNMALTTEAKAVLDAEVDKSAQMAEAAASASPFPNNS